MYYDPMIGKLVTYGSNREQALDTMERYADRTCRLRVLTACVDRFFIALRTTLLPFLQGIR